MRRLTLEGIGAGIVVVGLLILAAGGAFWAVVPQGRSLRLAGVVVVLLGLGVIGIVRLLD